jgi:hypothetical protein
LKISKGQSEVVDGRRTDNKEKRQREKTMTYNILKAGLTKLRTLLGQNLMAYLKVNLT